MFLFNGETKIIQGVYSPIAGSFLIDVQRDLYSAWKLWACSGNNTKFLQAFSTTGGDPISATLFVGAYFFLENGWKIRPTEADHRLVLAGNIYTRDDSSPFLAVSGYSVITEIRNSSLTQGITVSGSSSPGITLQDKKDIRDLVAADLNVVNANVKKASLLIPANQDIN